MAVERAPAESAAALREGAIAIARAAAVAILQVYESDFDVQRKLDTSPLTQADLAAHRIIVEGLERMTPDIPVLSEESVEDVPFEVRRHWSRLWLVDPLDGTREFVKRNGEFSVNLALVEDGEVVFAVLLAPVGGTLWHAQRGHGAFRRDGNAEVEVRVRCPAIPPLQVAASRSHRDPRSAAVLDAIARGVAMQPVGLGSSLKFCRIAEGALDVYPRLGPTSEWDTAAGQCILEAAGGAVLDLQGRPLRYNQRDTLLNGDFIAVGDTDLPWQGWVRGRD